MAAPISRRDSLLRIGSALGAVATSALGAGLTWDRYGNRIQADSIDERSKDFRVKETTHDAPQFAIARALADPGELTAKALAALGGMNRFISKNDVVCIKPNIGWDRAPIHAANTNPEVVAAVVRAAYDAGAKHVIVTDVSCNEANRSFQRSGIWKAAYEAGAELILPEEHRFKMHRMRMEMLDEWLLYKPLLDCDKLINIPVAKHHSLAKYTGAMKNWYGSLGGRRNRLHQNIDVSIADLATFFRPTLTILDGSRVLVRNGPQGGNIGDTLETRTIAASLDQVAIDAFGCTLIGQKADAIGYLKLAQERGLGTLDYTKLRLREV